MATNAPAVARVFRALADGQRVRIVEILHGHEGITIQELCTHFPVSRFAVMKHLHVLEEAGLLRRERDGNAKRLYLERAPLRAVCERWLSEHATPP